MTVAIGTSGLKCPQQFFPVSLLETTSLDYSSPAYLRDWRSSSTGGWHCTAILITLGSCTCGHAPSIRKGPSRGTQNQGHTLSHPFTVMRQGTMMNPIQVAKLPISIGVFLSGVLYSWTEAGCLGEEWTPAHECKDRYGVYCVIGLCILIPRPLTFGLGMRMGCEVEHSSFFFSICRLKEILN